MTIFTGRRTCRGCGCDDDHACVFRIHDRGKPVAYSWVLLDIETPTGVCSRCALMHDFDQDVLADMTNIPAVMGAPAQLVLP